jgi:hypothetical protein
VKVISRERVQEAARRHLVSGTGHSELIDLGKELAARWLVLGSYQRAGERLRILPRVVEVPTGEEVATAKIDGSWEDVFALQDRVVADVMAGLEVKIDSSAMERIAPPETLHLEAYEQYAQGRQQFYRLEKNHWSVRANTWSALSAWIQATRWRTLPWERHMLCATFTVPIRQTSTVLCAIRSARSNLTPNSVNLIRG